MVEETEIWHANGQAREGLVCEKNRVALFRFSYDLDFKKVLLDILERARRTTSVISERAIDYEEPAGVRSLRSSEAARDHQELLRAPGHALRPGRGTIALTFGNLSNNEVSLHLEDPSSLALAEPFRIVIVTVSAIPGGLVRVVRRRVVKVVGIRDSIVPVVLRPRMAGVADALERGGC